MDLSVTVTVTLKDYRAFVAYAQNQAKRAMQRESLLGTRLPSLLIWIGIGLSITFIANDPQSRIHAPSAIGAALISLITYGGLVWWHMTRLQEHMLPEPGGAVLGIHHYRFSDNGIHVDSSQGTALLKWAAVRSVEETPTHFFLMLDRCYSCILPKIAFADAKSMASFKSQFDEQLKRSSSSSVPAN